MPGGETHFKLWCLGATPIALATGYLYPHDLDMAVGLAAGYVIGGLLGDPDLDLAQRTEAETRMLSVFGWLGYVYLLFWLPYGKLASHGGISHKPLLGLASRVAYIAVVVAALILALVGIGQALSSAGAPSSVWTTVDRLSSVLAQTVPTWVVSHWVLIALFLGGWEIANLIHFTADFLHTERRPRKARR